MKKSLIALAALAATASFAQSSVQIDGIFDAGFQAIDYKGTKVNGINGNGSATSQLNIRGTEDLGGGLKADFRLESDFNTVSKQANTGVAYSSADAKGTASSFGNGEVRVGLQGNFGRVDLGAVNFNGLDTTTVGMPFGTAIGGGYSTIYRVNAAGTAIRDENAVKYTTPTFSGFNATLYKSNKQTKAADTVAFSATLGAYDKLGSEEIGLNYANGPLAASFSSLKQDSRDVAGGTTDSKLNTLGANYTIGAAKVFGLYQTNKKSDNSVNTKYYTISGTYTMGATTLIASAGELKDDTTGLTNSGKKSKIFGLGADYALSKRTALYARYESIDDKAVIAATSGMDGSGTKRTRTAFGLRHAF